MTIQRMPAARQIQIGFLGLLEAIRALTNGKVGEDKTSLPVAPMRFTLYDSCKTVRGIRNRPLVGFA
jgi:hypothetical protein